MNTLVVDILYFCCNILHICVNIAIPINRKIKIKIYILCRVAREATPFHCSYLNIIRRLFSVSFIHMDTLLLDII